jgi:hypothetical protein
MIIYTTPRYPDMNTTDCNNSEASATRYEWSFLLDAHPPGSPTEANSPTQEVPQCAFPYNLRPRCDKVKTGTWKVKEVGSWKDIIRNAGRTSYRRQRTKGRSQAGHRPGDSTGIRDATNGNDRSKGSRPLPGRRLTVEDFQRAFYGHRRDGSLAFGHLPGGQDLRHDTEVLEK